MELKCERSLLEKFDLWQWTLVLCMFIISLQNRTEACVLFVTRWLYLSNDVNHAVGVIKCVMYSLSCEWEMIESMQVFCFFLLFLEIFYRYLRDCLCKCDDNIVFSLFFL